MPPAAFLHPQNAPKSLAAAASPQTPLWELTALPRPPSWIKGATSKGRGKRMEGEGTGMGWKERWREGKGGTLDPHNVGNRLTPLFEKTFLTAVAGTSSLIENYVAVYATSTERPQTAASLFLSWGRKTPETNVQRLNSTNTVLWLCEALISIKHYL